MSAIAETVSVNPTLVYSSVYWNLLQMTPANPLEVAPATVPRLGVFETLSLVVKMAMVGK